MLIESESNVSLCGDEGTLHDGEDLHSSYSYSPSESESDDRDVTSSPSSIFSGVSERIPLEYDIGKLQDSGVDIKGLSRDHNYRLLTSEPNPDPLSYPSTRPCPSSSLCRFKPDWLKKHPWMYYTPMPIKQPPQVQTRLHWLKKHPWMHYSSFADGFTAGLVLCFLPIRLVVAILVSLSWSHSDTGQRPQIGQQRMQRMGTTALQWLQWPSSQHDTSHLPSLLILSLPVR